jgi:hypothetical protein
MGVRTNRTSSLSGYRSVPITSATFFDRFAGSGLFWQRFQIVSRRFRTETACDVRCIKNETDLARFFLHKKRCTCDCFKLCIA